MGEIPERGPKRWFAYSLRQTLVVALVAAGLSVGVVAATQAAHPTSAKADTPPSSPIAGTQLYSEGFSNQNAAINPIGITGYTGSGGQTYTADTNWRSTANMCNGWVLQSATNRPPATGAGSDTGCQTAAGTAWQALQGFANFLGQYQGFTGAALTGNQVLAEFTNSGNPGAGIEFQGNNVATGTAGHFYAVSAYYAATSCTASGPSLTFSLGVSGTFTALSSGLNPCNTTPTQKFYSGTFGSPAVVVGADVDKLQSAAIIAGGTAGSSVPLSVRLANANGSGVGNDTAFDTPSITDVTPQLDKNFSPTTITQGTASTLTFTLTNTSELLAKVGIPITDNLPAGVVVANPANASTTCTNSANTAGSSAALAAPSGSGAVTPGATSVGFFGSLPAQASCTFSISVTSNAVGTYTNTTSTNVTGIGFVPNGSTTLIVNPAPVFLCLVPTVFDANGSPTVLDQQFQTGGGSAFTPLPNPSTNTQWTYNALGFNKTTGYLYGVSQGNSPNGLVGHLVQIGSDGVIVDLGAITGMNAGDLATGVNVGFFDNSGNYWIANALGTGILYKVNLTTGVATALAGQTVGINSNDIAMLGTTGTLAWGVRNATGNSVSALTRIDLATGAVTFFTQGADGNTVSSILPIGTSVSQPTGQYGAAWTYANGHLGFDSNAGGLYQIAVTGNASGSGGAGPSFGLIANASGPASTNNDGAACGQPANMSVAKTGPAFTSLGGTVNWALTATNIGPGISSGFVVTDIVPSNYTGVAIDSVVVTNPAGGTPQTLTAAQAGCTTSAVDGGTPATAGTQIECVYGGGTTGFGVDATFVINLHGSYPLSAPAANGSTVPTAGCIVNTVSVLGNEQTSGTNSDGSNGATSQTCLGTPHISITKTPNPTSITDANQNIVYTFVVTNDGQQPLNNVTVTDVFTLGGTGAVTPISCLAGTNGAFSLAVGASTSCSMTYTSNLVDLVVGHVNNTALVTATPPNAPPITNTATASVPTSGTQAFTVQKGASGPDSDGDVTYTITVTNTGNLPYTGTGASSAGFVDDLSQVLDDAAFQNVTSTPTGWVITAPTGLSPPASNLTANGPLAVGASVTITYVVTVNNPDTGNHSLVNAVTPTGTDGGCAAAPASCTTTTPLGNLTVTKSVNPASGTAVTPGQSLSYTLSFANSGAGAAPVNYTDNLSKVLDDATVTANPALASGVGITPGAITAGAFAITGSLAPGASATITYTVIVNNPDTGDHQLDNFVVPTGTTPPSTCTGGTLCTSNPVAAYTIAKTVAGPNGSGQYIYTLTVVNTGNAAYTDPGNPATFSDNLAGVLDDATFVSTSNDGGWSVTGPTANVLSGHGALPVGGTVHISYIVQPVVPGTGDHSMVNVVTPGTNGGSCVTAGSCTTTSPLPNISVVKTSNPASGTSVTPGQSVTYSLAFHNSGGASGAVDFTDDLTKVLDDATVTVNPAVTSGTGPVVAPIAGGTFGIGGTLAAGASATVSYTVTVNTPDTGDHDLANFVVPTGTTTPATCVGGTNCTTNPVADISIVKTPNPTSVTAAGQTVSYSFLVTNTGATPLTNVAVADHFTTGSDSRLSAITCPGGNGTFPLAVGASTTCTATYTTAQADIDNGTIKNTATATGTTPANGTVTSTADATVTANATHSYTVSKVASGPDSNGIVSYTVTVINTGSGNFTAGSPANIDDNLVNVLDDASYVAGSASSTVTGWTFTAPSGTTGAAAHLTGNGPLAAGQTATISYQVKINTPDTGDSTLTNVVTPGGNPSGSCTSAPACTTTTNLPNLTVSKSVNPESGTVVTQGSSLSYTLTFQNTGTVAAPVDYTDDLADVTDDATITAGPTASNPALTVGSIVAGAFPITGSVPPNSIVTVSYTVQVLPFGGQQPANFVLDNYLYPTGSTPPTSCDPASALCTTNPVQAYTIAKTATGPNASGVITYHLTITNTGAVAYTAGAPASFGDNLSQVLNGATFNAGSAQSTVTGWTFDEPSGAGTTLTGGGPLAVGATATISYAVTVKPNTTSSVTNVVVPTGPGGTCTTSSSCSVTTPLPVLIAAKSVDPSSGSVVTPGQVLSYTVTLDNSSGAASANADYTDTMTGVLDDATLTSPPAFTTPQPDLSLTVTGSTFRVQGPIQPGAVVVVQYTVTVDSPVNPSGDKVLTNFFLPTGTTPPANCGTAPAGSCTENPIASISIVKSTLTQAITTAGQIVSYGFHVTNTGATTLTNVNVVDVLTPPSFPTNLPVNCPAVTLAPGASTDCTAVYVTTQADVDAGSVADTAVANGTPPSSPPVTSPPSAVTIPVTQTPGITIDKSVTPTTVSTAGTSVSYTFHATNTGNVTLTNVTINDTSFTGSGALGPITCTPTNGTITLAPGASIDCTAAYTMTQADIDAGQVSNTATATGAPPTGGPVTSPPDSATVTTNPTNGISVAKSSLTAAITAVGQHVTYSFLVTNTGTSTLTNVSVTDTQIAPSSNSNLTAVGCGTTTLQPGASTTCTASYTVSQADLDNGSVADTAVAHGTPSSGTPIDSPPSNLTIPATTTPALSLVKTANPTTVSAPGDTVSYTFTATNTGDVTLSNVGITESAFSGSGALGAITCGNPAQPNNTVTLAPNASITCTATYTVTQADIDSGSITNTAVSTGNPPTGQPVTSNPDSATVTASPAPALTIDKTVSPTSVTVAGTPVSYTFHVTNTGNVTLHSVTVNDTAFSGSGTLGPISCTPANGGITLTPGASIDCTAAYTVTQADVDAGSVTNTATATGTPPTGSPVTSPPDDAVVTATQTSGITIDKSVTPTSVTTAGTPVSYTFQVTNTGNTTLAAVTVNDTSFTGSGTLGPISCTPANGSITLAPGASIDCTAAYTLTQTDINSGSVTNTATATGTPPDGTPITSPPDNAVVTTNPNSSLTVVKSSPSSTITTAGQSVTYSFLVTNTGNTTLNNVNVTDVQTAPSLGSSLSAITCPDVILEPGDSTTCTASYTVSQADLDNGGVTDTATAHGTPSGAPNPIDSPPSPLTIPAQTTSSIAITKAADPTAASNAGTPVTYTFHVTNTGNTTLTNVEVDETAFSGTGTLGPISCTPSNGSITLAPNASIDCTAGYTLTQADVNAGQVTNTAIASGTPPTGTPIDSTPADAVVTITPAPSLTLLKSTLTTQITTVGQQVPYSFLVTNTGNVTLTGINVTDVPQPPADGTLTAVICNDTTLLPGASTSCSASYTVTQADLDHGSTTDIATAHGTPPGTTTPVDSNPSTVTVPAQTTSSLTVAKSVSPGTVSVAGTPVVYSFLVTNTGTTTLSDVTVNDTAFSGSGTLGPIGCTPPNGSITLAPGATISCTAGYTVTQADVNAGQVTNTATATGTPPTGGPVTSPPDNATVTVSQTPAISIVKSSTTPAISTVGQQVPYAFTVTNSGNVDLSSISVTDVQTSPSSNANLTAISCPLATLIPGESEDCTATYTVTQADLDNGSVTDTAVAHGTPAGTGTPIDSQPSELTIPATTTSSIAITKSVTPTSVTNAGDSVTYTFHVQNTGTTTLNDVTVNETAFSGTGTAPAIDCTPTNGTITLAPGASIDCTASYSLTQADVNVGQVMNTATASGNPPTGAPVTSPPSSAEVTVTPAPSLTIVKSSLTTLLQTVGQQVVYSFLVTNVGNVTLSSLNVTDVQTAPSLGSDLTTIDCPSISLAPGASTTCTATYTVTQADLDNGGVTDVATAHGTPPGTTTPIDSNQSPLNIPSETTPALTIVKNVSPTTVSAAGDTVNYTFHVTNSGTSTLTDVTVNETAFSGTGTPLSISCTPANGTITLAPGASVDCTAGYTVTQADIDAGTVTNTATATGTPPTGTPVTSLPSSAEVTANPTPSITVAKKSTTTQITTVGEQVPYVFTVTNTGNTTCNL